MLEGRDYVIPDDVKALALSTLELSVARADIPGLEMPVFVGSIRDVSVRKNAEEAARAAECDEDEARWEERLRKVTKKPVRSPKT